MTRKNRIATLIGLAVLVGGIIGHTLVTAISERLSRDTGPSDEELEALDTVDSTVRTTEGTWPLWKTGPGTN